LSDSLGSFMYPSSPLLILAREKSLCLLYASGGDSCCSVLQCVAVCCSVLQCVAVYSQELDIGKRGESLPLEETLSTHPITWEK